MRRTLSLMFYLLPLLLLSQDSTVVKQVEWITLDTVEVSTQKIPEQELISFWVTEDVKGYVEEYFDFMERFNIDPEPLKVYDGMYTVNYLEPFNKGNDNVLALTFKAYPEEGVDGMTIILVGKSGLELKTLVFHELSHAMTYNKLPHCKDWVNCSAIFAEHLQGLQGRIEKYWDMEEEKLANMILLFQKYDPKYKDEE